VTDRFFTLQLMGAFALRGLDGKAISISARKNRALLAILALSPGLCATREKLANLLWGNFAEEQARSSLRQSLAVLRKELGAHEAQLLSVSDNMIALNGNALAVDAARVLQADTDAVLPEGILLADFGLHEESFDNWLDEQRRLIHAASIRLLEKRIKAETGAEKIGSCEKLVSLDPLRESAQRALMQAYADAGEKALALRQFDVCTKLLRAELGVEPAAETQNLRREIMADVHASGMGQETPLPNDRPSVALLPFDGMGGDAEHLHFCDGFRAEIIMELSRWKSLTVRSRFSSKPFAAGQERDLAAIARQLKVKYLVEGAVRRTADLLRISVQLIDAENDKLVWSEKFDLKADDMISAHDRVVHEIVSTLVGRLRVIDEQKVARKPASNYSAYECVLIGNALNCCIDAELSAASKLFEQAVTLDPGYAAAHGLLVHNYIMRWQLFFDAPSRLIDKALEHAKRAVALDESDSNSYSALAIACLHKGWHDATLEHATRALALNPNNQWNLGDMGAMLYYLGRADEAVHYFKRARAADPYFGPDWYWSDLGQSLMVLGRYDEALAALERVSVPTYRVSAFRAGCCARLGKDDLAKAYAKDVYRQRTDFDLAKFIGKEPYKFEHDKAQLRQSLALAGLS